ncbi:cell division protein FtsQ/DivIB [Pelosinus sp. sgz500959]|uniref:cell division protein FtsQ/DivIB n=1 Tax=Pelosinus sp. sgz500959 TaxID=3242472 RepID=UPI003672CF7D
MMSSEKFQYPRKDKYPMSALGFVWLLLILIILIAGLLFIKSSYFSVGSVVVEGNKYVSTEEVYRIANIPESINIFNLNTANIQTRLMHDLRIAETDVSRRFPGTIVINIKERKPMAYIASNYGFLELDGQGIVLAVYKNIKQVNVPMITGIRLENQYVGDTIDNVVVKKIVQYLSLLDEKALNQFSEINSKASEQIIAYTINSMYIRLGNSERLPDKANITNEMLHELNDKKISVEYVDLNFASPVIKFKQ